MDRAKNNMSLLLGIPGLLIQLIAYIAGPFLAEQMSFSDKLALEISLVGLLVGTGLLIAGMCYYARAKGQSGWYGLLGFLGIIGLIVLGALPDRHAHSQRIDKITNRICDLPEPNAVEFRCQGCGYQLNGTTGSSCPECGRPFDPEDLRTVQVVGIDELKAPWMGRWSLICGIFSILCSMTLFCGPVVAITGIIFGHAARAQIRKYRLPGDGVAVGGLVTSYTGLALGFIMLIVFFMRL